MRGSIIKRSKTSWALVLDQGRDATTGRRKQKWVSWRVPRGVSQRDAYKQAEAALAKLLNDVNAGTFVDPLTTTLVAYLRDWHTKAIVPFKTWETARVYRTMIDHVEEHAIGRMPLQKVRPTDLEAFYATRTLAANSVKMLHSVIRAALKLAVRDRLLVSNPADAVEHRPRLPARSETARTNCLSATEARRVLKVADDTGPQVAAFIALAFDTGARRAELLGLTWADVDLDTASVTIARQLDRRGRTTPTWAPTKTHTIRRVPLNTETVKRLRAHRKQQRELLMKNRTTYQDHGLVFAKEHDDLQTPRAQLGQPAWALVERHFRRLMKAAGVAITPHGCRHTTATLALAATVPVQVVAQRLGHARATQTLDVYAHALPDMQHDATAKLGAMLAGKSC